MSRLPVGICAYSFGYAIGWRGRSADLDAPGQLDALGLIALAADAGLSSVEFPPALLGPEPLDPGRLNAVREALEAHRLGYVFDAGLVLEEPMEERLQTAHRLGARTMRVILSRLLCGDRSPMKGRWPQHLKAIVQRLRQVEPMARDLGVAIALENHQDADSDDLVQLCETLDSPAIGVNLDAGNALAVGEDPVEFAQKVAPFLKNVHLKDYRMIRSVDGYRLVRCALGEGVLDWKSLFALWDAQAPQALRNIELGAMQERPIRLFRPEWWEHYPPRDVRTLLGPLRLLAEHGLPPETDPRVPLDRGGPPEAQLRYEMDQFHRSVRFLRTLLQTDETTQEATTSSRTARDPKHQRRS